MNTEKSRKSSSSGIQSKTITIYFPKEDTSDSMVPEQIEKMKQSLKRIQHDVVYPADEKESPQKKELCRKRKDAAMYFVQPQEYNIDKPNGKQPIQKRLDKRKSTICLRERKMKNADEED